MASYEVPAKIYSNITEQLIQEEVKDNGRAYWKSECLERAELYKTKYGPMEEVKNNRQRDVSIKKKRPGLSAIEANKAAQN